MSLAIGIDIGGTKVAGGLVDEEGNVIARARRDTPHRSTKAAVVEDLLVFGAGKSVRGVDRHRLVGVVPQCLRHENRLPRDASGA